MKSAFMIADRIIMLYQGKVEIEGSPDEIKNSTNPIIKQFIAGSSRGPVKVV